MAETYLDLATELAVLEQAEKVPRPSQALEDAYFLRRKELVEALSVSVKRIAEFGAALRELRWQAERRGLWSGAAFEDMILEQTDKLSGVKDV